MNKLLAFLNQFNNADFILPQSVETKNELLETMTDLYRSAVSKNYLREDKYESGVFGVSQLGKPAIITAWDHFNGVENNPPSFAMKRKWFGGHTFEIEVYMYLHRLGYEVQHQVSIQVSELIQGHPDFVVTDPTTQQRFVVECKHVDDAKYKAYRKYGMNNQQYQTQLALYASHLNCDAIWVVGNACTGEVMGLPVTNEQVHTFYDELIMRAQMVTVACAASSSLEEVLKNGMAPPFPRRRKDGSFYISPEMYSGKGRLHPACSLYDFYEEDGKYYVKGWNYPEGARGYEPELDWS